MPGEKVKISRKKRTKQELMIACDAFAYEMWMFNKTVKELICQPKHSQILTNILIDSFVIHTRNLLDFFCPNRPHRDDIIAEDFFSSPNKWTSNSPQDFGLDLCIQNIRFRINKMAAHLTYTRLNIKDKSWKFKEISTYINKLYEKFYNSFDKKYLGDRFKNLSNEIYTDGQDILTG